MPPEIVDEINASQESLRIQVWFRNQRIQAAMKARELSKYGNVILDTCFITSEVHIILITFPIYYSLYSTSFKILHL